MRKHKRLAKHLLSPYDNNEEKIVRLSEEVASILDEMSELRYKLRQLELRVKEL